MEQLINLVAQKANISPDQAKKAVSTVTEFLKTKLPAGVNIDSILSGNPARKSDRYDWWHVREKIVPSS